MSTALATTVVPTERDVHRCVRGTVGAVVEVAPWLRRLTVRVPDMQGYDVLGPDEYVGLVMPRPGAALPDLSSVRGPNPRPVLGALPEAVRPDVRWYTVRGWRPATAELDLEIVLHPAGEVAEGPGATWLRGVRAGDPVAVQTGSASFVPDSGARVRLVAGDETAYPAIAGILEATQGRGQALHVLLEVGRTGVLPDLPTPGTGSLTVVVRGDRRTGEALLEAVRAADLSDLDDAWVAGEQELAASVRRHLVTERGVARTSVYFCAYWILGRPRG
ncbi:siderophore-interacting protein [Ornithinimicrobium cerasi]|uniref:NADPH-dependent ferric siderophore reductase, contains FAD-binding and SIP domains n=1 Tax=Ornithinimicrobium cerasi TaxID=2248773 RepID=A0A285VRP5_9MICO|nr:siderophore-interacting protein [Ornithinimicrobium cerasi]SOC56557.1 NADPH-dependent ferric siderophore reductase, contains FAD-binding and SIP domains [Ornithinimicrobium cerasi]